MTQIVAACERQTSVPVLYRQPTIPWYHILNTRLRVLFRRTRTDLLAIQIQATQQTER